jgi:L-alanine-DL-glutamate epimerase-like enolase superfamily enzyme
MIKSITVTEKSISLRAPFVTALRSVSAYPVIQVEIQFIDGRIGIGECVATPQISGDSHEGILQQLHSPAVQDLNEISPEIISKLEIFPSAKAALDMALWNTEIHPSCSIATDVTIPIAELKDLREIVQERVNAGFDTFKLKVKEDELSDLLQRIEIIRELAGQAAIIRIDPNQAWSLEYAVLATREIAKSGANIEYLEQPLPKADLLGHTALAQECNIPLMADESCFSQEDLEKVVSTRAFKYLNVKILKAGGVVPALQIANQAINSGLKVSIGSMMEGVLGIRAAIYLAHQIAPETTHDLDAAWWFKESPINYQGSIVHT